MANRRHGESPHVRWACGARAYGAGQYPTPPSSCKRKSPAAHARLPCADDRRPFGAVRNMNAFQSNLC
ncbi:hypothetical protein [Azospirillum argentinense]